MGIITVETTADSSFELDETVILNFLPQDLDRLVVPLAPLAVGTILNDDPIL